MCTARTTAFLDTVSVALRVPFAPPAEAGTPLDATEPAVLTVKEAIEAGVAAVI